MRGSSRFIADSRTITRRKAIVRFIVPVSAWTDKVRQLTHLNMFRAEVTVTLRPGILDVQGKTVEQSLHALGYDKVGMVRIGKFVTLDVDVSSPEQAEKMVNELSLRLLSNPVIEEYSVQINELDGAVR